ncbi:hypothetical protein DEJ24_12730 [Curtobacterium sp. MCPF17_001]|nr:hypothetical protein DEJ24_12730 [Curtobacterium sp. MCPF17_001]
MIRLRAASCFRSTRVSEAFSAPAICSAMNRSYRHHRTWSRSVPCVLRYRVPNKEELMLTVEDRSQISETLARHAFVVDENRLDQLGEVFTPDAT